MAAKTEGAFDYDQEKAMLVKRSNMLEGSLDADFDKVKYYFEEYGKNFLVISGTLLATYTLLRILTRSSSEEEKPQLKSIPLKSEVYASQPQQVIKVVKEESEIMKQIKLSIALFLISIAKQKLQEFLLKKEASK